MTSDKHTGEGPAEGEITVAEASEEERAWVYRFIEQRWGPVLISRGRVYQVDRLGALVASVGEDRVGVLTYRLADGSLEVLTVDALVPGAGVGTALLAEVEEVGRRAGVRRVWLVTTNDNLDALNFYLRRGLRIVGVHLDALEAARRLKPSIPMRGENGIPVRDEIELEVVLDDPRRRSALPG